MLNSITDQIAGIRRLLREGHGVEAETVARKLQQQYPAQGEVNHVLALVLIRQRKDGEAIVFATIWLT